MILIITHKEDYTSDYIINKLNQRKIKYERLNCEDLIKSNFTINENLDLVFQGKKKFKSVWFRRTKLPNIDNININERAFLLNGYESLLKNLFCIIDAKWLSDPYSVYKAENKLYQLKIANKLGFITPNTLVTNSKDTLKKFYLNNSKNIILKPLSQSKINFGNETKHIFTNVLKEEHINNIENYDLTPCIYQENIQKEIELRITVVGEKVFSAGVNSQNFEDTKTDWRKGELKFFKENVPIEIEKKCILLLKELNLVFGAIDLIKDQNGNYIFLEINPNGQWAWIETDTNLKISDSIINELL